MNADPAAQRRLLDLADTDAELDRTAHRRRTLAELAEIAGLEAQLRARRDAVIAADTLISDLDRDSRRLETEIEAVRAREDRDRNLLKQGVGARQVSDLEHELDTLQRRQAALEDDLLELMERRENADADAAKAREALAATEAQLADATGRRDAAFTELDDLVRRRTADRAALTAELPADLLTLYDRIRAQKGTGAALLRSRRCGACRLELDRSALVKLRDAAPDAVLRCEECGVVLIRTPQSGL
ncbi:MAG TPA: C4-type zinc ribbon domain-containing protein [Pseudonocardiaceae bacterium]|nr:C4-type zinc ribbon domain-containing protein [Pseudonocardiaceae bacterium]